MIYTLTLSPSLDYVINNETFNSDGINRVSDAQILPGGKGINASIVLARLGYKNEAISFFDESSFGFVDKCFQKEQINLFNIASVENTRINVKFSSPKNHFEINGQKTKISPKMLTQLKTKLATLTKDDFLLIMGLADETILNTILKIVFKAQIPFLMDIDTPKLKDYVKTYKPFLIKPNKDELKRLFDLEITNQKDMIKALKSIKDLGVQNVIISLDSKGSFLITKDQQIFKAKIIKPLTKVVSGVGAGDTLIATFAAIYQKTNDPLKAFWKANAAAMGTVSQVWLTDKKLTKKYLEQIEVKKISK